MSDPTLVTQIITTGTASVSVIGADGSGKSKVLTAAEVRTAAETISETAINTALSDKQATLVSGTNIKTVNSTSLLGAGDIAISSGGSLADVIRSTDANLSAAVNTWYHWDISGLTADRTLTLPATAAVGDRVAVTITTGDDAYEVLITAASGDTLATIAGGTEWSRLFITGEVVVMRCIVANTTWIVEYDGRVHEYSELSSAATTSYTLGAYTRYTYGNFSDPYNLRSGNYVVPRRAGLYYVSAFELFTYTGGSERDIGVTWGSTSGTGNTGAIKQVIYVGSGQFSLTAAVERHEVTTLGNGFTGFYWTDAAGSYSSFEQWKPRLYVRRIG